MITYTHTTLLISNKDAQKVSIDAYVAENGLAYHKTNYSDHHGPDWTVSHVATGLMLKGAGHFLNEGQCRAFIARICELTNWTAREPILTDEIKLRVESIAAMECLNTLKVTYL